MNKFAKIEEVSLIFSPSYAFVCHAGNLRGNFMWVWLTLLHKDNPVYSIVPVF